MKYFVYGDIYLRNGDWVEQYIRGINGFIEKHEGKVLSRSVNMEKIEADPNLERFQILDGTPPTITPPNFQRWLTTGFAFPLQTPSRVLFARIRFQKFC